MYEDGGVLVPRWIVPALSVHVAADADVPEVCEFVGHTLTAAFSPILDITYDPATAAPIMIAPTTILPPNVSGAPTNEAMAIDASASAERAPIHPPAERPTEAEKLHPPPWFLSC